MVFILNGLGFGEDSIQMKHPNNKDKWKLGSTQDIEWHQITNTSTNTPAFYKVTLRQNNNESCVIKLSYGKDDALANGGLMIATHSYIWKLKWDKVGHCKSGGNIVVQPGTYVVRVFNLVTNDFVNSDPFLIYDVKAQKEPEGVKVAKKKLFLPPYLVISPKANAKWFLGSKQTIEWSTKAEPGNYKLILRRNNQKVEVIKDGVSNYDVSQNGQRYTYEWDWNKAGYCINNVVAESGANYKIRFRNKITNKYFDSPAFTLYGLKLKKAPTMKKINPSR
jgi:hypothetical protein